jgi:peptidoglycan hydrolase-like protein with peptidoglycan-binding domain
MKAITAAICSLALGVLCLSLAPVVSAADKSAGLDQQGIKNAQQSLSDKGFYHGSIDGIIGPHTRAGIREYQKSVSLPVTGRLDAATAGKLGVAPESEGADFKQAGQDVGKGGQDMGHQMKEGKPLAGGKEFGQEVGHAGKKVGQGVKKAASPSDSGQKNP